MDTSEKEREKDKEEEGDERSQSDLFAEDLEAFRS
jgi:hypothetical protein